MEDLLRLYADSLDHGLKVKYFMFKQSSLENVYKNIQKAPNFFESLSGRTDENFGQKFTVHSQSWNHEAYRTLINFA